MVTGNPKSNNTKHRSLFIRGTIERRRGKERAWDDVDVERKEMSLRLFGQRALHCAFILNVVRKHSLLPGGEVKMGMIDFSVRMWLLRQC